MKHYYKLAQNLCICKVLNGFADLLAPDFLKLLCELPCAYDVDVSQDLKDIAGYVARHDSPEKAIRLLTNLEETCEKLEDYPDRGHGPKELVRLEIFQYLEVYYKPYRILYEIAHNIVYVHCIIDGRRDIESVLRQRLLR